MSEKLSQIKKILVALGVYYNKELSSELFEMYAEDLEDLSLEEILLAVKLIRKDPSKRFFPLPAEIREKVLGNEQQEAVNAAGRIVEAMAKYGYTNPEKAKEYMGDLSWAIVKREGGWQSLCERTKNDELPILKAQWREMAKAIKTENINKKSLLTKIKEDYDNEKEWPQITHGKRIGDKQLNK
jgi:hypothetical protein